MRGILLKGSGWAELQADVLAMSAELVVVTVVAVTRFRQTLD